MSATFSELRFWCPLMGADAARLSMVDSHGGEFFKIIAVPDGKGYREARDLAFDEIEDAMARGDEPGEVSE